MGLRLINHSQLQGAGKQKIWFLSISCTILRLPESLKNLFWVIAEAHLSASIRRLQKRVSCSAGRVERVLSLRTLGADMPNKSMLPRGATRSVVMPELRGFVTDQPFCSAEATQKYTFMSFFAHVNRTGIVEEFEGKCTAILAHKSVAKRSEQIIIQHDITEFP